MQETQIVLYMEALGDELVQRGFSIADKIEILIAGGTYMVMHVHNRASTEDIDVLFLSDHIDLTKLPLSQQEKAFRAAVKAVAKQFKLKQSWFNDDAGPFLAEYIPQPQKVYWRDFGPIKAYFPSKEAMLVYKICGYSAKQQGDVYALAQELNLHTYDEVKAVIDALVSKKAQKDFDVEDTIDNLFD
ncbi:hypothetical protein KDA_77130 [Dictyobacter alpinus]|uniref:Nucleotidyltransferase n=1 Tax=Dictyobacter alpinus TaxID=2014873 RepID=A0A402BLM0_9CHLR|nr:hypothetical protein [Dictyobacter alpinus]GCE32229.1 hypothetical protein KDA_77130 [Dictyobacter alpinus]